MTGSFKTNVIVRILLLVSSGLATGWSLAAGSEAHNSIVLGLITTAFAINLLWYINTINKKLAYFFEAVKNDDHGLVFPHHKGDKFMSSLARNLKRINEHIRQVKIENLLQEQYFGAIIEHIGTGILSYDNRGFVVHANSSLKKLLGMNQFTHLRQLEKIDSTLSETVMNLRHNDEKLVTLNRMDGPLTLLIKSGGFISNEQPLTLISIQDIRKELDEKELESWLRLIRVLTHEIMNSIAPVTSLSENLCNYYMKDGEAIPVEEVNERIVQNTIKGLKVINEQGRNLIKFVESYRKLTRLPDPVKARVSVRELVDKTVMLYRQDLEEKQIKLSAIIENGGMEIEIDENQVIQVLINLVKNAAEALTGRQGAEIEISSVTNAEGRVEIMVADNGPGISPELIDEIFIPFFTTREEGNGIGLSLSRQIMRLHNGSLKVRSIPERETVFTMTF